MVGRVGVEPTIPEGADLQSAAFADSLPTQGKPIQVHRSFGSISLLLYRIYRLRKDIDCISCGDIQRTVSCRSRRIAAAAYGQRELNPRFRSESPVCSTISP